jgi:hypothetical protein
MTTSLPETSMRYLFLTVLILAACERRADNVVVDTLSTDTVARAGQDRDPAMKAVPDRLLGTWTAKGYDEGSDRAQEFTMSWTRSPDGSMVGTISFRPGETYDVKVVSVSDTVIVYESAPHRSPTLNAQVVTRSRARVVGDTLVGTYEAKATQSGKTLRGRFTATRTK